MPGTPSGKPSCVFLLYFGSSELAGPEDWHESAYSPPKQSASSFFPGNANANNCQNTVC